VAFVSTDFLGFPAVLGDRVRHQVRSIPATNILIGATHTHSAPDCYAFPNGRGGTDADLDYLDFVCNSAAEAINEAVAGLQPVSLRIATGKATGKIAYNYYAPQLYDPRCSVMQAVGRDGKPFATLVNYAIHPEVLGSSQGILSPDMVGPLYDRLAANGGGTGIFMNGALGGMVTADVRGPDGEDVQTWEECQRIGHLLADEALRIVSGATAQSNPAIRCTGRDVTLPVDSPMLLAIMKTSPLRLAKPDENTITTHVNLVQVGDAHAQRARLLRLPQRQGWHRRGSRLSRFRLQLGRRGDQLGGRRAATGVAADRHRQGHREDRLQLLRAATVRPAL